jgi:hypothetical protein
MKSLLKRGENQTNLTIKHIQAKTKINKPQQQNKSNIISEYRA